MNLNQLNAVVPKYCYLLRFPKKSTFIFNFFKKFSIGTLGFSELSCYSSAQANSINGIKIEQKHVRQIVIEMCSKHGVIKKFQSSYLETCVKAPSL